MTVLNIILGRNKDSVSYKGLHGKGLLVHAMLNIITVCYHNSHMISPMIRYSDMFLQEIFKNLFWLDMCLSVYL